MTHPSFDFVQESGGIREYRLRRNGLQVLLLPSAAAPVATLMVTYRVGSRNEGLGLTGATHFLEHLMFKGTERFNRGSGTSIFHTLQRVGAQINATTWFDRTNYYELLPREHLALAIEIEADRMRGALISQDDVESERTVILNEFDRGQNEPVRNLYHSVWSAAFEAHPYHHPTIGWRSDIEHVTPDGLRHFYDSYYWPSNATVSVIGDFEPGLVFDLLDRHFGPISSAPAEVPPVTTREPEQRGERRVTVRQAGQLGAVMVAYKSPPALDADTDALDVLASILASGKSSRLYRLLTDAGLTTHLSATASRLRDPGLFYAFGFLAPSADHAAVEAGIEHAIADIQREGVRDEEVERAKNQLKAQQAFGRDGSFAIAAQLNEAIAAGDWTLYTTLYDRIARVSAEDVQRAAVTYCVPERRTVGYYVPTVSDQPVRSDETARLSVEEID